MTPVLLAALASTSIVAEEFRCEGVKPTLERAPAYEKSADGARCEGFYEVPVQGPYLELLSVFKSGAAGSGPLLTLSTSHDAQRIVVLPLLQGIPYRADLAVRAGVALWDPALMLKSTALQLDQLGFMAFGPSTEGHSVDIVPVSIGKSTGAVSAVAVIRTSVPTREIKWRVAPDALGVGGTWSPIPDSALRQWDLAAFVVAPDAGSKTGKTIQVRATGEDERFFPVLQFHLAGD